MTGMADLAHVLSLYAKAEANESGGTMYRVEFGFAYGGTYYSETFTDKRDVRNMVEDIEDSGGRVRFIGVDVSEDGETWDMINLVDL